MPMLHYMLLPAQLADRLEADGTVHQLDSLTSAVVAVDASRDHARHDTAHASSRVDSGNVCAQLGSSHATDISSSWVRWSRLPTSGQKVHEKAQQIPRSNRGHGVPPLLLRLPYGDADWVSVKFFTATALPPAFDA